MNDQCDPCTAHFRRVHYAIGVRQPYVEWMQEHAFLVTLWKRDPTNGFEPAVRWHRAVCDCIYDRGYSFRPAIYATDTDPPKSYVHALLLIPDEALQAFEALRANGQLPHIDAVAQTVVEPFDERLVRMRFPRDPAQPRMWTSLMAQHLRPPKAI
jgi:hypothetical protein